MSGTQTKAMWKTRQLFVLTGKAFHVTQKVNLDGLLGGLERRRTTLVGHRKTLHLLKRFFSYLLSHERVKIYVPICVKRPVPVLNS